MKKEKSKWAKGVNRDEAKNLGFHLGVRKTLEFLAQEGAIDADFVAWLLEEKYIERIKKENEKTL